MKKTVLFDLDGTLTDSGEGIINCAALALAHFGLPVPSREELRVFVGPPLYESFQNRSQPQTKCLRLWFYIFSRRFRSRISSRVRQSRSSVSHGSAPSITAASICN